MTMLERVARDESPNVGKVLDAVVAACTLPPSGARQKLIEALADVLVYAAHPSFVIDAALSEGAKEGE